MLSKLLRHSLKPSVLALCVALNAAPLHAETIVSPDDETIELLASYLSGNTPNFREDALNSYEYRRANEFDKPQVLQDIESQLRTRYEGFADVNGLELRVSGNIGQFDAAAGVYRISVFKPGTYFPFKRGYALFLDNASDFYEWSLPVAEARKIRDLSPRGAVTVELTVVPFGVAPNDQRHVRGQVVSMKLFEQRSGQLLHEVIVPSDERREITSTASQQPSSVDDAQLVLAGVQLGMPVDEALGILQEAGYAIGEDLNTSSRFSTYEDGLDAQLRSPLIAASQEEMQFPHAEHFTRDLNCGDETRVHSCGIVYFDPATRLVESMSLLQNAVGTSKQDITTTLFERFGPAGDRFNAYLWREHAVDQYVWGSFTEAKLRNHSFTEISGPKHWQIEAFIAEPTPQRKTVIVQINSIASDTAVTGDGGIKF